MLPGIIIFIKELHPWNIPVFSVFTPFGMFIFFKFVQFLNAPRPISAIVSGNYMFSNLVHDSNAYTPIFVTLFGISISIKL